MRVQRCWREERWGSEKATVTITVDNGRTYSRSLLEMRRMPLGLRGASGPPVGRRARLWLRCGRCALSDMQHRRASGDAEGLQGRHRQERLAALSEKGKVAEERATAIGLFNYAESYRQAADRIRSSRAKPLSFDAPIRLLYAQTSGLLSERGSFRRHRLDDAPACATHRLDVRGRAAKAKIRELSPVATCHPPRHRSTGQSYGRCGPIFG
jgi:hypothetical protein